LYLAYRPFFDRYHPALRFRKSWLVALFRRIGYRAEIADWHFSLFFILLTVVAVLTCDTLWLYDYYRYFLPGLLLYVTFLHY